MCLSYFYMCTSADVSPACVQERFRVEADVAVNRANMLTRLWKYASPEVMDSEYLLHAGVFSMVEFDDDIFAAGNCYDQVRQTFGEH